MSTDYCTILDILRPSREKYVFVIRYDRKRYSYSYLEKYNTKSFEEIWCLKRGTKDRVVSKFLVDLFHFAANMYLANQVKFPAKISVDTHTSKN